MAPRFETGFSKLMIAARQRDEDGRPVWWAQQRHGLERGIVVWVGAGAGGGEGRVSQ